MRWDGGSFLIWGQMDAMCHSLHSEPCIFWGTFEPQLPDQHWAYWANDAEIPTLHGGLNHVILFTANRNNARSRKVFPYEYPKFLFMDIMEYFLMNILKWTSLILSVLVRDVFLHVRLGTPDPHGSALNPGKLVVKGWRMTRCGGT